MLTNKHQVFLTGISRMATWSVNTDTSSLASEPIPSMQPSTAGDANYSVVSLKTTTSDIKTFEISCKVKYTESFNAWADIRIEDQKKTFDSESEVSKAIGGQPYEVTLAQEKPDDLKAKQT
jgi:hypothetical protein